MERRSDRLQFTDPAKLADDTVLALSFMERGRKVPAELLKNGVKLCDYLIQILNELKTPQIKEEEGTFHGVRDETKALLEKISRMQRFLRLQPEMANRPEVVGIFVMALDGVLANLGAVLERLSEPQTLDQWDRLAVTRRLSDTFDSISELHTQLQFIYGTWVRPETHVFIKDILEFIPSPFNEC